MQECSVELTHSEGRFLTGCSCFAGPAAAAAAAGCMGCCPDTQSPLVSGPAVCAAMCAARLVGRVCSAMGPEDMARMCSVFTFKPMLLGHQLACRLNCQRSRAHSLPGSEQPQAAFAAADHVQLQGRVQRLCPPRAGHRAQAADRRQGAAAASGQSDQALRRGSPACPRSAWPA